MLKKQYDNNQALSLLIFWGKICFTTQDPQEKHDKLEEWLNNHLKYKKEDFISELDQGIGVLVKSVKEALNLIRSREIFNLFPSQPKLSPEDACFREKIKNMLLVFEDVIYFQQAFFSWDRLCQLDNYDDWSEVMEKIHWDIDDPEYFPKWYRLIPINKYRRIRRKTILPVFHDCFPWLNGGEVFRSESLLYELVDKITEGNIPPLYNLLYSNIRTYEPDLAKHLEKLAENERWFEDLIMFHARH